MAFNGEPSASIRRGCYYRVSYPTLPSLTDGLPLPQSIVIVQQPYAHDVAILEFPLLNEQAMKNLKTGVPISFTWTKDGRANEWIGYVSFVSSEKNTTPRKRLAVHCIGSSFPLKAKKTRVFKNKTIPQVAAIIAKENGFKFEGKPSKRTFKQLTISGQSYWEWLQEQAKRIGYAMYVEGMTLVFTPIDDLIDTTVTDTPVLSYFAPDFPTDTLLHDRTLDYFKASNGEYMEGGELRTKKVVHGVHPVTGKPVKASKTPKNVGKNTRSKVNDVFFEEQRTGQVVHDALDATTAAEGAAHMARFTTPAVVRCQGDSRIRPYVPVYIDGISDQIDGYWVATSVKHTMTILGEYQIEMSVASEGSGKNKKTSTRPGDKALVGKVDVAAVIKNGGKNPSRTAKKLVILKQTKQRVTESNQGFNRTPVLWASKPKPVRKVIK